MLRRLLVQIPLYHPLENCHVFLIFPSQFLRYVDKSPGIFWNFYIISQHLQACLRQIIVSPAASTAPQSPQRHFVTRKPPLRNPPQSSSLFCYSRRALHHSSYYCFEFSINTSLPPRRLTFPTMFLGMHSIHGNSAPPNSKRKASPLSVMRQMRRTRLRLLPPIRISPSALDSFTKPALIQQTFACHK